MHTLWALNWIGGIVLIGRLDSVLNATVCITLTAFNGYLEMKLQEFIKYNFVILVHMLPAMQILAGSLLQPTNNFSHLTREN